jgi:hypothetical protein
VRGADRPVLKLAVGGDQPQLDARAETLTGGQESLQAGRPSAHDAEDRTVGTQCAHEDKTHSRRRAPHP